MTTAIGVPNLPATVTAQVSKLRGRVMMNGGGSPIPPCISGTTKEPLFHTVTVTWGVRFSSNPLTVMKSISWGILVQITMKGAVSFLIPAIENERADSNENISLFSYGIDFLGMPEIRQA